MENDMNSLSHSKWRCKYHIVFAPKYRRMVIYRQLRVDVGKILRTLCEQKKVNMPETDKCFVLAENRNDILKFMESVTDKNDVSFEPIFTKEDIEKGETIPTFFYDVLDCENGKVEIKINGASRTIDVPEK